jgi:hypothetical protein
MLTFLSAQARRLEHEQDARKLVKEKLENTNDSDLFSVLKSLSFEYFRDIERETGIKDSDNVLCSGFAYFFSEYEEEFQIDITHEDGKWTLRRVLQELDSFLAGYYHRIRTEFRGSTDEIVISSNTGVRAILRAVRRFLIPKASEEVATSSSPTGDTKHSTPEVTEDEIAAPKTRVSQRQKKVLSQRCHCRQRQPRRLP